MTKPYHVKIGPKACMQIKALSPKSMRLALKLTEALSINPRPPGAKKLEGLHGLYTESFNQHRMIYKIEDQEILILLVKSSPF